MSHIKKALQQLQNEKEFYTQMLLKQKNYLAWKQSVKHEIVAEIESLLQCDTMDEERFIVLLKKHPIFVKMILDRNVLLQIRPWYQAHPSEEFKRQKRQHLALVDSLSILCARSKKQLRALILNLSNGQIAISVSETDQKIISTSLPLPPQHPHQLKHALKQYQVMVKLGQTLTSDHSPYQKLQTFKQQFQDPSTQAVLRQYPTFSVVNIFKKLIALFQFEQWIESQTPANDDPFLGHQNVFSALKKQIKQIAL
jgi:hypothetical protein